MPYFLHIDTAGLAIGPCGDFPTAPGPDWIAGAETDYRKRWNGSAWVSGPERVAFEAAQAAEQPERDRQSSISRNALAVSIFRDLCNAAGDSEWELLIRVVDQLVNRQSNPTAAMTTFRARWQTAKDQATAALLAARRA